MSSYPRACAARAKSRCHAKAALLSVREGSTSAAPGQREVMAHPDVVVDHAAIAEPLDGIDDPFRRDIIQIVVGCRDAEAVLAIRN